MPSSRSSVVPARAHMFFRAGQAQLQKLSSFALTLPLAAFCACATWVFARGTSWCLHVWQHRPLPSPRSLQSFEVRNAEASSLKPQDRVAALGFSMLATFAGIFARKHWPQTRIRNATRSVSVGRQAAGRKVSVRLESRVERVLRQTQAEMVDKLLASEGLNLMVAGAESMAPSEETGKVYCYMPVFESPIPGIRNTQVRMTCSIRVPRSGLAILTTDEFANLLEDEKTGVMTFDETWSTRGVIKAESTNTLSFRQIGPDVSMVSSVRASSSSPLPDWFPIPEEVFNPVVQTFALEAFKGAQIKMLDVFEERCAKSS